MIHNKLKRIYIATRRAFLLQFWSVALLLLLLLGDVDRWRIILNNRASTQRHERRKNRMGGVCVTWSISGFDCVVCTVCHDEQETNKHNKFNSLQRQRTRK
jgi:hypothetical protein